MRLDKILQLKREKGGQHNTWTSLKQAILALMAYQEWEIKESHGSTERTIASLSNTPIEQQGQ
jgi:hypothetical protein